jgi:hypothetical protein
LLGFAERSPALFYPLVYELPEEELMDLVYLFETVSRGISGEIEAHLQGAIEEWRRLYLTSTLTYRDDGQRLIIRDARANRPPADYVFEDPGQVLTYRALGRTRSLSGLHRELAASGVDLTLEQVARFVGELKRLGLVFEDDGRFVALATHAAPHLGRVAV